MTVRPIALRFVFFAAAAVSTACAHGLDMRNEERESRPAPRFDTMPREVVHSAMWQLARGTERIQVVMRSTPAGTLPGDEQRAEVLDALAAMEAIAATLSSEEAKSSHPMLARNVDAFAAEIATARRAVERDPPNYFWAGTIAGACAHCHGTSGP